MFLHSLLLSCTLACANSAPPPEPTPEEARRQLDAIVADFKRSDPEAQEAVAKRLDAMQFDADLSIQALRAAAGPFPPPKRSSNDACTLLVNAAIDWMDERSIPVIRTSFAKYTPGGQRNALYALSKRWSRESAEAFLEVVRANAKQLDDGYQLYYHRFAEPPRHPDLLLPALFDIVEYPGHANGVFDLAIEFQKKGLLPKPAIDKAGEAVVNALKSVRPIVDDYERARPHSSCRSYAFRVAQSAIESALELAAAVESDAPINSARSLLTVKDPLIRLACITYLLERRQPVDRELIAQLAAIPESRTGIYKLAKKFNRLTDVPEQCRTQDALAEAAAVTDIASPAIETEPPTDIKLIGVVTATTIAEQPEHVAMYLYLYRTWLEKSAQPSEWQLLRCGPFKLGTEPATEPSDQTFNHDAKGRSPQRHLNEMVSLLRDRWMWLIESVRLGPKD